MSRIGKLPIALPAGTTAKLQDGFLVVKGPKGELKELLHSAVVVNITEKEIEVGIKNQEDKKEKALWGLFRSLANNMVMGVNTPYEKKLEINGVGYRAAVSGNKITLNLGFSHPIDFKLPEGITAAIDKNVITLTGINKQSVGETAAQIRKLRKPEPYKGKGIKYADEVIRRKAGKSSAKGGKK